MRYFALLFLFNAISHANEGHTTLHEDECRAMGFKETDAPEWEDRDRHPWKNCLATSAENFGDLIRDDAGRNVLHIAAIHGNGEVIEFILNNHGATNALLLNNRDNLGNTPLHYAVEHGHRKVFELLLNSGADIQLENNEGMSASDMLFENPLSKATTPQPNENPVPMTPDDYNRGSANGQAPTIPDTQKMIQRYMKAVGDAVFPSESDNPWVGFSMWATTPEKVLASKVKEVCYRRGGGCPSSTEKFDVQEEFQDHPQFFKLMGYEWDRDYYVQLRDEMLKDASQLYWGKGTFNEQDIVMIFGEVFEGLWVGLYSIATYD